MEGGKEEKKERWQRGVRKRGREEGWVIQKASK